MGAFAEVYNTILIAYISFHLFYETSGENTASVCASFPCRNDGTCVPDSKGWYTCSCLDVYEGDFCERLKVCNTRRLCNGGTCVNGTSGEHSCFCNSDREGENCEIVKTLCSSSPCTDGGTCRVNMGAPKGYTCACPDGSEGSACHSKYDGCGSSPCGLGSTCVPNNSSFQGYDCICPEEPEFFMCRRKYGYPDPCKRLSCENEATCSTVSFPHGLRARCLCRNGYYGSNCEWKIGDPCHGYCKNGGTCYFKLVPFGKVKGFFKEKKKCRCSEAYDGQRCQARKCPEGFIGHKCEIKTSVKVEKDDYVPCEINNCRNGGTCKVHGVKPHWWNSCECSNGFKGPLCQERIKGVTMKPKQPEEPVVPETNVTEI